MIRKCKLFSIQWLSRDENIIIYLVYIVPTSVHMSFICDMDDRQRLIAHPGRERTLDRTLTIASVCFRLRDLTQLIVSGTSEKLLIY